MPILKVFLLIFILLLSACAFSPGSHLASKSTSLSLDDIIDIEPITQQWLEQQTLLSVASQTLPARLQAQIDAYEYRIGPGDVLAIVVLNNPELNEMSTIIPGLSGVQVRSDGTLFFPFIGDIEVSGKTVKVVQSELTEQLAEFIADPQVLVSITEFNAHKVFFSGNIAGPKTIPIRNAPLTLVDAISEIGGVDQNANWHSIYLNRDGSVEEISFFNMMRHGDQSQNRLLQPNDIIYLPSLEDQSVAVLGQVVRAGRIALGNERLSLTDAIAQTGGLNENTAQASGVFVVRPQPRGAAKVAKVYQLDVSNAAAFALGSQFILQPKDIVYVTSAPIARWNRVISSLLPSFRLQGQTTQTLSDLSEL